MLTHRNKKPYECKAEGCGKSYCDARSLRRHTENHHTSLAMTPTTPNQSSNGPPTGLSLSPATASGKYYFNKCCNNNKHLHYYRYLYYGTNVRISDFYFIFYRSQKTTSGA